MSKQTHVDVDQGLKQAAIDGDLERIDAMCRASASTIEHFGKEGTALHLAAAYGHRGAVQKLMVQYGADAFSKNSDNQTPLDIAKVNGYDDMATLLCPESIKLMSAMHDGQSTPSSFASPNSDASSCILDGDEGTDLPQITASSQSLPRRTQETLITALEKRTNRFDDVESSVMAQLVTRFERIQVQPGTVVMQEGEHSSAFYVIETGVYAVKDTSGRVLSTMNHNGCFGEMSIELCVPCTCNVVAEVSGVVWRLPRSWFASLLRVASRSLRASEDLAAEDGHKGFFGRKKRGFFRKKSAKKDRDGSLSRKSGLWRNSGKKNRPRKGTDESDEGSLSSRGSIASQGGVEGKDKKDKKNRARSHSSAKERMSSVFNALSSNKKSTLTKKSQPAKPAKVRTDEKGAVCLVWKDSEQYRQAAQILAGSTEAIIAHIIDPEFFENFEFMRHFVLSYRYFTTALVVVESLVKAFYNPPDEPAKKKAYTERILKFFTSWTQTTHFVWDYELWRDARVQDLLMDFVNQLVGDPNLSELALNLRENLRAGLPQEPQKADVPMSFRSLPLTVEVTKEGGLRDDLVFQVDSTTSLLDVQEMVGKHYRDQKRDVEDSSGGLYLDETAYEFHTPAFGTVLELNVNVFQSQVRKVSFMPIKVYSAGLCLAEYLDAELIAHIMTHLDHQTFCKIRPEELVDQAWSKKPDTAPNVCALTERFNKFCEWAVSIILKEDRPKQRALVIEKMLEVGTECLNLHNFHGVTQVLAVLKNPAVARLKKSWAMISGVSQSLYGCLESILDPKNNRAVYRAKLEAVVKTPFQDVSALGSRKSSSPCLPYLGTFLSDIVFCEDGNNDEIDAFQARNITEATPGYDDVTLVNFYKFRSLAKLLEDLKAYQLTPYTPEDLTALASRADPNSLDFDHVQHAEWFLNSCVPAMDEDRAWEISTKLEKPGTNEQKGRKQEGDSTIGNNFVWRTCDDQGMGDIDVKIDHNSNSAGDSDEWRKWYSRFSNKPTISFMGSFEYKPSATLDIDMQCQKVISRKRSKQNIRTVVCEIREDEIIVSDSNTKDLVLKRPLEKIEFYKFDKKFALFYFIASEYNTKFCHLFQDQKDDATVNSGHEAEDVFLYVHRNIQRWSKSSQKASNEARNLAVTRLNNTKYPAPVGAFVVRDSTSRAGCYALTMKMHTNVVHFLVERTRAGSVRFKDSVHEFKSLKELIMGYCVAQLDLPNKLRLEGSVFLTDDCQRIASNTLPTSMDDIGTTRQTPAWFFGPLSRMDAEALLTQPCVEEGMFLVRESSSGKNHFAMSFACGDQIVHVLITEQDTGFAIDGKWCGRTLEEVIGTCCSLEQRWLPVTLTEPVPKGRRNYDDVEDETQSATEEQAGVYWTRGGNESDNGPPPAQQRAAAQPESKPQNTYSGVGSSRQPQPQQPIPRQTQPKARKLKTSTPSSPKPRRIKRFSNTVREIEL